MIFLCPNTKSECNPQLHHCYYVDTKPLWPYSSKHSSRESIKVKSIKYQEQTSRRICQQQYKQTANAVHSSRANWQSTLSMIYRNIIKFQNINLCFHSFPYISWDHLQAARSIHVGWGEIGLFLPQRERETIAIQYFDI